MSKDTTKSAENKKAAFKKARKKNKREKKKIGCQNYHSDHLLSFISCPFVPNIFL